MIKFHRTRFGKHCGDMIITSPSDAEVILVYSPPYSGNDTVTDQCTSQEYIPLLKQRLGVYPSEHGVLAQEISNICKKHIICNEISK